MTTQVPFFDMCRANAEVHDAIQEACRRVVDSGWYILGPELEAFESEFAQACGCRHAVGVGNGQDALALLLKGLGVGPGDEVIVPAMTFVATWMSVSALGATPVGVDVDPATANVDPDAAAAAVTPRTRAIVAVHLYGRLAPMRALRALAERHGLALVEDAAQAHGAARDGQPAGSLADGAAFSFYPAKNLGALGDGGAVTTSDTGLAERVRLLRNYGARRKYVHEEVATNSRLDEMQAAVLRVKLPHLDRWNRTRRAIAARYRGEAGDSVRAAGGTVLGRPDDGDGAVWHQVVVTSPVRDRLAAALAARGIATGIHYPTPCHLQTAYRAQHRPGQFPVAERLAETVLSLPVGPYMASGEVQAVVGALRAALGQVAANGPPEGLAQAGDDLTARGC